ncbi:hydroxyethylthiazole kinase [Serinicoccus kebangsaanensis]|uniref:hydroxyethylthiazole kinase n=1 Tax=Serinicoccus kebangsaanensis TaxID=2602069 RepID=UPI00124CF619|nr:hydroxyethylthiazole kinase [Serinicoccus kebangsaanensis]
MTSAPVLPDQLASCWALLRRDSPLTQCITNIVAAPLSANLLLAAGAAPAMVDNLHEAGEFAAAAGGLLVNLGTPSDGTAEGMRVAVASAASANTPWVLDPVAAGALGWRTALAHELVERSRPAVVRGNASEVSALAGGAGGRGVDATDTVETTAPVAEELARHHRCVVAVSGPVDHLTDGRRVVRVPHGHPLMTRVTGVGCGLGALMAACCAVSTDRLVAAVTATVALTLAAESAADRAAAPGSFAVVLVDELSTLTPEALEDRVQLS